MTSQTDHPGYRVRQAGNAAGPGGPAFTPAYRTRAFRELWLRRDRADRGTVGWAGNDRSPDLRAMALATLLGCLPSAGHAQTLAPLDRPPSSTPSFGQVATRSAYPSAFQRGTFRVMARTLHIARGPITSLRLAFANSYLQAGVGEAATGAAATITAAIEYPAGAFTRVTFGGSAQGTIPDNSYIVSDSTGIAIPRGATFWVRSFYDNPAGFVYFNVGTANALPADSFAFAARQVDQTMGGTITGGNGSGIGYFPVAIVAPTPGPADCLFGDSRVVGIKDVRDDASNDGGELARALGATDAYMMMAVSGGRLLQDGLGDHENRVALSRYCTAGVDEYGINDLAAGASAASVVAGRTAFAALFPNLPMAGTTLAPVTGSADQWKTSAGQSVSGFEAGRGGFNGSERAGIAGEVGVIDISDALDPNRTGLWPVDGQASWSTADGVHETNTGNGLVIRRSDIWNRIGAHPRRTATPASDPPGLSARSRP